MITLYRKTKQKVQLGWILIKSAKNLDSLSKNIPFDTINYFRLYMHWRCIWNKLGHARFCSVLINPRMCFNFCLRPSKTYSIFVLFPIYGCLKMTSSVPYKYCVKLIKKLKCCIAWFIWTGIPTQNVEFWTEKKPDFFIPLRMLLGTCNDNYGLVASHLFLGFLLSVDPK